MTRSGGFTHGAAPRRFQDRREAGRVLAEQLSAYRDDDRVLVLGLARGGVPVAREVATALHAPLEVFIVRKLGVPHRPELAMGALASGGRVVMNDSVLASLNISDEEVRAVIACETAELHRREQLYRGDHTGADLRGRTVILVDDGIATGATMLVAVQAVRAGQPASIVVAVPVGPASACRSIGRHADDVVCAATPPDFNAVGQVYADFHQVSDDEVRELLRR